MCSVKDARITGMCSVNDVRLTDMCSVNDVRLASMCSVSEVGLTSMCSVNDVFSLNEVVGSETQLQVSDIIKFYNVAHSPLEVGADKFTFSVYSDPHLRVTKNYFLKFKTQDLRHLLLLTTDYTFANKNTECLLKSTSGVTV